jgi:enoyl-CoA hydratase
MDYHYIKVETKDGITIITLNRPEVRNALSLAMLDEVEDAFRAADEDGAVAAVIFTGEGKAFSAGLDLKDIESFMAAEADPKKDVLFAGEGAFCTVREMNKPVICAVNGFAVTGGLELVLACDIIIASENARFADTHAQVGIVPGAGMSQILPRMIGIYKAKFLSFTGEFMDAGAAYQAGLVSLVVPHDRLMDEAMRIAQSITSKNPDVIKRIKRMIDEGGALSLKEGMEYEAREFSDWKKGIKKLG